MQYTQTEELTSKAPSCFSCATAGAAGLQVPYYESANLKFIYRRTKKKLYVIHMVGQC